MLDWGASRVTLTRRTCDCAAGRASWIVELRKWEKDWKAKQERWLQTKGKVLAEDWDRLFLGEASIATRVRRRKRAPEDEEDLDITPDVVMPKVKELVRVHVRACVRVSAPVFVCWFVLEQHLTRTLFTWRSTATAASQHCRRKEKEGGSSTCGRRPSLCSQQAK